MPGIMVYFVLALVIILGLMWAVPSDGAVLAPLPVPLSQQG